MRSAFVLVLSAILLGGSFPAHAQITNSDSVENDDPAADSWKGCPWLETWDTNVPLPPKPKGTIQFGTEWYVVTDPKTYKTFRVELQDCGAPRELVSAFSDWQITQFIYRWGFQFVAVGGGLSATAIVFYGPIVGWLAVPGVGSLIVGGPLMAVAGHKGAYERFRTQADAYLVNVKAVAEQEIQETLAGAEQCLEGTAIEPCIQAMALAARPEPWIKSPDMQAKRERVQQHFAEKVAPVAGKAVIQISDGCLIPDDFYELDRAALEANRDACAPLPRAHKNLVDGYAWAGLPDKSQEIASSTQAVQTLVTANANMMNGRIKALEVYDFCLSIKFEYSDALRTKLEAFDRDFPTASQYMSQPELRRVDAHVQKLVKTFERVHKKRQAKQRKAVLKMINTASRYAPAGQPAGQASRTRAPTNEERKAKCQCICRSNGRIVVPATKLGGGNWCSDTWETFGCKREKNNSFQSVWTKGPGC